MAICRRLPLVYCTTNDGATIGEDPADGYAFRDTGLPGPFLKNWMAWTIRPQEKSEGTINIYVTASQWSKVEDRTYLLIFLHRTVLIKLSEH